MSRSSRNPWTAVTLSARNTSHRAPSTSTSFRPMSPEPPPSAYAPYMATSARYSWFTHALSLVNEYGSTVWMRASRTMSRPKATCPQRSGSAGV